MILKPRCFLDPTHNKNQLNFMIFKFLVKKIIVNRSLREQIFSEILQIQQVQEFPLANIKAIFCVNMLSLFLRKLIKKFSEKSRMLQKYERP